MKSRKPIFRTRFFIEPSIQLSLSSAYFLVVTTAALFLGLTARALFAHMVHLGMQINLYAGHPYFKQVELVSQAFYHRLFLGLILCLVAGMGISIFVSHRMVGPVLRLKKYFEEMKTNQDVPESPLRFRQGDFFSDLPAIVNGALLDLKNSNADLDVTVKINV